MEITTKGLSDLVSKDTGMKADDVERIIGASSLIIGKLLTEGHSVKFAWLGRFKPIQEPKPTFSFMVDGHGKLNPPLHYLPDYFKESK